MRRLPKYSVHLSRWHPYVLNYIYCNSTRIKPTEKLINSSSTDRTGLFGLFYKTLVWLGFYKKILHLFYCYFIFHTKYCTWWVCSLLCCIQKSFMLNFYSISLCYIHLCIKKISMFNQHKQNLVEKKNWKMKEISNKM
jgi:hypothetical protein